MSLKPDNWPDAIAAVLAIAALRSRYRKTNNANSLKNIADSSGTFREELDSSAKKSVIHDNQVL